MSLAAIPAKRIATQTPASGSISAVLDAIYNAGQSATYFDGSSRTPGSGIAHNTSRYQSGGTTEAVYASLPTGSYKWLMAGNAAGTACTMASPDTQAASRLLGGLCKSPGAFNAWTNAAPFTSGTWFGFWRSVSCGSVTIAKVHVWETAETWTVVLEDSGGALYRMDIGCFIDPDSTDSLDAESDGRLAGVRTTGATAITSAFWTAAAGGNTWLTHSTTDGQAHVGIWQPGAATLWPLYMVNAPRVSTTTGIKAPSGRLRRYRPIWQRSASAPNDVTVGIDRIIAVTPDSKFGKKLSSTGGTEIGWTCAGSASSDQDADLILS